MIKNSFTASSSAESALLIRTIKSSKRSMQILKGGALRLWRTDPESVNNETRGVFHQSPIELSDTLSPHLR
jgi:hypothetical protein